MRHCTGDNPREVRGFGEAEYHSGDIRAAGVAGGHHVLSVRVRGSYGAGGILKFEAMPEYEIVPLGSVLTKILLEFGGRSCLDMTDLRTEGVADTQQALVCAAIPGLVGNGSGRQECDPKWRGTLLGLSIR